MAQSSVSRVLATGVLEAAAAAKHLRSKLMVESDPSDIYADRANGVNGFVVVDARSAENFEQGHVPGAISLPWRTINAATTADLPREKVIVTYCDGNGCNGSTNAALKLSELGFKVKEMIGGIDWWKRDGYSVETGAETTETRLVACGC
jgi:rhodanese-related sulfurtransferase